MQQHGKILIVDDNRASILVLTKVLGQDYQLATADCGEEALDIAPVFCPDLILLDVIMPGIDGYETCRRLRTIPVLGSTKIVFVSATDLVSERLQAYEAGADDCLPKPFEVEELRAKIRVYLCLKSAEEGLHISEERFALAMRGTNEGLWDWDVLTNEVYYSPRLKALLEYEEHEFAHVFETFTSHLHPDDTEAAFRAINNHLEHHKPFDVEYRLRTKSGEYRLFHARGQAVWDAAGKPLRVVGSLRDITKSKQTEVMLRASEERFQQIAANLPQGMIFQFVLHPDGSAEMPYISPSCQDLCGLASEAVQNDVSSFIDMVHPEDKKAHRESIQASAETLQPWNWEGRWLVDGAVRWFRGASRPERQANGDILWNGLLMDVSGYKEMEGALRTSQAQLQHAQKLESIGQLAAGIAHEINTPTQYISDNTAFLKKAFGRLLDALQSCQPLVETLNQDTPDPAVLAHAQQTFKTAKLDYLLKQVPRALDQSLAGLERVAGIVGAMKEFSHPSQGQKELVNLRQTIETTLMVARSEWKYVAELVTEFDEALPAVPCLRDEFNQVILNLVVNAAHAIAAVPGTASGTKGTITVTTQRAGDWAEIRISDTGTGIPEDIREKIFDPFFTTKEVGKGTGQGLAIAYSAIVDKHAGRIEVESEVGRGTTFILQLPLTEPHPPAVEGLAA